MKPMLAKIMDSNTLVAYVEDPEWYVEQKLDGVRVLIEVTENGVKACNRAGDPKQLDVSIPDLSRFSMLPIGTVLDSEVVDGTFFLFDALTEQSFDAPFYQRRAVLEELFEEHLETDPLVKLVPCAKTHEQKAKLAMAALKQNAEGLMLKYRYAAYHPGERSEDMLKCKFTKDVDVVVTSVRNNDVESAGVAVYRDGELKTLGTVSMIGKPDSIVPGSVVTVTYLYATEDGHLYQPRITSGPRTDNAPEECLWDQLQYTDRSLIRVDV